MSVSRQFITTQNGLKLYRDDNDPQRLYVLPTAFDVAVTAEGSYHFSLIFYQSDFPEQGARLVMALSPCYPQLEPAEVVQVAGHEAELVGLPFSGGDIQLIWPDVMTSLEPVQHIVNGIIHIETSLSQAQAQMLRQIFKNGTQTVRLFARLVYSQVTERLPVKAQLNIRQVALALQQAGHETLTGLHLRSLLNDLPPSAIELKAQGPLDGLSNQELLTKSSFVLGPLLAGAIADLESNELTFDDKRFRLRQPDQVEEAEVWIDLAHPKPWSDTWQGEWSMTDFRKKVEAESRVADYFPEVQHVPLIGSASVLVENLLTLTPDAIQELQVGLKYRYLGSLEEKEVYANFKPESGPVASYDIPVIAFTPFHYRFKVSLRLAPQAPDQPAELVPPNPQWQESDQPLVRVGKGYLPYSLVYISAEPGVFNYIGRAEIEIAAAGDEPPQVAGQAVLTAAQPGQWLLIRALPAATQQIRWRPIFYQDPEGDSNSVAGNWRTESTSWPVLETWDVLPREPKKIQATVQIEDTLDLRWLTLQLRSGSNLEQTEVHDLNWSFSTGESKTFVLWPDSLFEQDFTYRCGLTLAGGDIYWSAWKVGEGDSLIVNVADEFYTTQTIDVTLTGPWADQASPDSSSRKGEIIFAEVHLSLPDAPTSQSRSFTFDKDNKGASFTWTIRMQKGAERYLYKVDLLGVDGRLRTFGPYESNKTRLALQVVRKHVSDTAPPIFEVKEI